VLLLTTVITAGCGAAPASTAGTVAPASSATSQAPLASAALAPSPAPSPGAQQTALTYAFPDDQASALAATELVKVYTAAHPEVQINAKPLPAKDYPQQLLAQIDADAPDLFVTADAQAPALIKREALLDLRSLLAGGSQLRADDFQPAALAAWQRGDALYGLPADVVPQVLFYNQDLFDAGGVSYPAAGWTWDDWLAKAQRLTVRKDGQVTSYGTALGTWAGMVWGNGGELVDQAGARTLLDSPKAAAGVQFAADMVNVHRVAPPPKDAGGPDPAQLFREQHVAMMPGPSSLAGALLGAKLPFKWAIAPLPAGPVPASPLSISGMAVSARSEHQQAALDFAAWVVGPAGSAVKAGILPFAAPALRAAAARPAKVSGADAILQALDHGRTLPQVEPWPQVKALVDKALVPVWQGKTTAAEAYREVAPEVNALLGGA